MAAPKGNEFWKQRSTHGRRKIFGTPEIMWDAACEYFQWAYDNPLEEPIVYQGEVSKETKSLMRAMTLGGLCIFLGTHTGYFTDFEADLDLETDTGKDFSRVIDSIRCVIRSQKFEGAAAGLLNPNIIARDLGLADTKEISGKNGAPIKTEHATTFNFIPVGSKKDKEDE